MWPASGCWAARYVSAGFRGQHTQFSLTVLAVAMYLDHAGTGNVNLFI